MRTFYGVMALAAVVLASAVPTASAGLTYSASDDAGKFARDKGRGFVSLLLDAGLTQNRITVRYDAARPSTIVDKPFLDTYVPKATRQGVELVFAVYPETPTGITGTPDGQSRFVSFLTTVARTYPQVTKIIVGNEPNQPRFWQPQFNADGTAAAGPAYEAMLSQAYDALKAVNPNIRVIGVGVNSRGNDNASAPSNISTSPVKFIRDMGAAYKTSGRNAPIMDELSIHPYPAESTDSIDKGFNWPNAGFANLDRIKQAMYDAFHGTAQPIFAEGGAGGGLSMRIDEIGWQTAVPGSSAQAYTGAENVNVTDDATQASIYADLVKRSACDPSLSTLSFFGIIDEGDLSAFQGGLMRADGTVRPSYDAVRAAIAETRGQCSGQAVTWQHAAAVAGARPTFGKLTPRPSKQTSWAFAATSTEDSTYRAGILRVKGPRGGTRAKISRTLARRTTTTLTRTGPLKAYYSPRIQFAKRRLADGWYVYAIRLTASLNGERTSFFVSKPFRVGAAKKQT